MVSDLIIFAIRFIVIIDIFVVDRIRFWTHSNLKEICSYITEIIFIFTVD